MSTNPRVIKPADRETALDVLGTKVTVLASGEDSNRQQITLQSGSEGTGPPPHSHEWNEWFFVTAGQIRFTVAGETTICPVGTLVQIPAGTVHSFAYGPAGGEMIEITGGQSQAIAMFTALAREMPPGPPDAAQAIRVLGEHGVKVQL